MNETLKQHGAFSWSELSVDNVESAISFYTEVIGWEIETMEMPQGKYHVLKANGVPVGGIMAKPKGCEQTPDHWGTYITVDNVDKTLAKAEAAGGKAVYPPMDLPGVGRMCAISDKGGAVVSIITYEIKE
ncbi:Glyoxalase family protein [Candidatus Nitrotoga sp. BS]|uniref:VOC family protein n=1 Tax=Candidatus Nitrotoga sp. BS TaxID=2890408 RepID=UPI001EF37D75|nr:VOC family protein [Candidatus Nitrotoga sp. BS]CAH1209340.1 Glyoxalase family protein [Candidatus Nitrotoga sp. BS]